jgi:hypothetical protein
MLDAFYGISEMLCSMVCWFGKMPDDLRALVKCPWQMAKCLGVTMDWFR